MAHASVSARAQLGPGARLPMTRHIDQFFPGLVRTGYRVTSPPDNLYNCIAWAAGDIIENRPALSRWHPDWADAFKEYLAG